MKLNINRNKCHFSFFLILIVSIINPFCLSIPVIGNTFEQILNSSVENKNDQTRKEIIFQSFPPNFEYNEVRCILKDYKGYMWFGTVSGLVRFDGIHLYVYENNPDDSASISYNCVNALIEDKNKNLWVGTSFGLNLFNREMDNFIHVGRINSNLNRLNNNYIKALCVDKNSLLWIGTFGDGVNVYNHEKQEVYHYSYDINEQNAISSNRIKCITIDHENNIWLGSQNGLSLFIDTINGFRRFFSEKGNPESLSNNNINDLAVDLNGNIWVGTIEGGINKLIKSDNKYRFKRYLSNSEKGSLSSNHILCLNVDKTGNLWIGTENGGLNFLHVNSEYFKVFKVEEGNPSSLSSNSIWSLYNDDENRLWIATYNSGINIYDEKFSKFESYQKNIANKFSLTDNDVKGFTEDTRGNIWIATDGGGICRFDPETRKFNRIIINSKENNFLANNAIQTILFDSKENLWIGSWAGGVDRLDKNGLTIENYKLENELGAKNKNIISLYEDSKGNIWVGTAGSGLFIYNTETNFFDQIDCNGQSRTVTQTAYITSILEDSEDLIWIGTLYGITILKRDTDQKFTYQDFHREDIPTLSSNMINAIYKDSKKRLWFGTLDNGLNLLNRQDTTFTVIQKKDGLPSNSINGILEDNEGFLWVMTNKGISKFNYDSLSFINYTIEDGLNSNEFYSHSCLRTKKGEFFLGGENGFNTFYPQNIKNNNYIPPVYLTNLKINNIEAKIGAKKSPLKKHIGETNEITLNHKQSSFTIEFVALNYTRPSKNQFSYMLKGFDSDWNYVENNRSASYTNIKPGKYVFMVKGSNNDEIWNNSPTCLYIKISTPYFKRWWAILIYVVFICVLIFFSLKIWNERIRIKHQLKLEQLAREKEHELNESNIQFFTNISHEFRTPLSLIIAPLESIIRSSQSKIKEQLVVIYHNAQRLLHLTNNLMDFRKLEEGRTSLKVRHGDIVSFVTEVSSYFDVISKRRHIKFTIENLNSNIEGWFDSDKLETILLNLLSNAFKHTLDKGIIRIVIKILDHSDIEKTYSNQKNNGFHSNQYVEIEVIDNGTGIPSKELPLIFEKYYQSISSKNKKNKGTGIGLALSKGLVNIHKGFIKAESIPNYRTSFTIALPIDRTVYKEDELISEPANILERTILNYPDYVKQVKISNSACSNHYEEKPEILVIEDNYELRNFLVKELGEEFNISQAEDGKIGIELAFQNIPDLIISDILMPNFSGIDLCKTIKKDIRTCHIPVILLTAKASIDDQIEGIEIGADVYITKPFNMQLLFTQLNQIIQLRRTLYSHFSQDVYIMPKKITDNKLDQDFLQKVIDYIILNIADNNLNVEGLAGAMNLSRSNIYRKIKALTGETIIEFIRIVRLKHAIKLMETKKHSLAEIAYMTGFTSPSYFTKSFKDYYGKPPSEYME